MEQVWVSRSVLVLLLMVMNIMLVEHYKCDQTDSDPRAFARDSVYVMELLEEFISVCL
jgi:hypothetical protein